MDARLIEACLPNLDHYVGIEPRADTIEDAKTNLNKCEKDIKVCVLYMYVYVNSKVYYLQLRDINLSTSGIDRDHKRGYSDTRHFQNFHRIHPTPEIKAK